MDLERMKKQILINPELQYFKKLGQDLLSLSIEELGKSIDEKILFDLEVEK